MIIKLKGFSSSSGEKKGGDVESTAYNGMVGTGKIGLGVGAGLLGLGAVEVGRAAYQAPSLVKDAKDVMQLRNNKAVREAVKKGIHESVRELPIIVPGLEGMIVSGIKKGEGVYNKTKFSALDRLQRGINVVNQASNQSRTVLGNAENWTKMAKDKLMKNNPHLNTKEINSLVDRGVGAVGKLSKMGLRVKNAKVLGKAGLAIGGISGAAYLHGKELESYKNRLGASGQGQQDNAKVEKKKSQKQS